MKTRKEKKDEEKEIELAYLQQLSEDDSIKKYKDLEEPTKDKIILEGTRSKKKQVNITVIGQEKVIMWNYYSYMLKNQPKKQKNRYS